MRLLFLTAAAAIASAPSPAAGPSPAGKMTILNPNAEAPADCPPTSRYHAMQRGGPIAAQRLGELPAADLYLSVYRKVGGCEAPIIAGYGYGLPRGEPNPGR